MAKEPKYDNLPAEELPPYQLYKRWQKATGYKSMDRFGKLPRAEALEAIKKSKTPPGWKEAGQLTTDGKIKAPDHVIAANKGKLKGISRTPMIKEAEDIEILGELKPKSKEFVEAFNRILRFEYSKSIDQDPFQVMGASPGKGWRRPDADILIIHGDVLRSTDGKQLAITEWSEDDAGTLIFDISPKIPDKEIPALLRAYYDYSMESVPIGRYDEREEILPGAEIHPTHLRSVELKEDGRIIRKEAGTNYTSYFKHIQVWQHHKTREEATNHIQDAVPRIRVAAKRVLNQQYTDFNTEEEAKAFFKDKKMMDYIPIRIRNPYHPDMWMYYEGQYGIFGLNASSTREHKVDKWVEFWSKGD